MKLIKQIFLIILILTTVGLLFRGWIYRNLVTYKSVGLRTNYPAKDKKLTDYINANTNIQTDLDIKQIVKLGLSKTSRQLNYVSS